MRIFKKFFLITTSMKQFSQHISGPEGYQTAMRDALKKILEDPVGVANQNSTKSLVVRKSLDHLLRVLQVSL